VSEEARRLFHENANAPAPPTDLPVLRKFYDAYNQGLLAKALAPGMIQRKRGKIINVSSQAGVIGQPSHGAYAASKGGLNMLTKVMCVEWAKHNIQINSVCPTVILTPMGETVWGPPEVGDPMKAKIPAARFGKPVEVADMILYLASSASDLVNGQDLLIDGGYTAV